MNIRKALHWATNTLEKISPSMNLDAEVLLSHALKKPREFLFIHPEKKLSKNQLTKYQNLIRRRAKHEPVAYLTGQKEFYGLNFKVSPTTLIPRPETELLVEETLKRIKNKTCLIDVGTGSGCIPIAISNQIRKSESSGYPDIIYATDISPAALKIARQNARHHGVKIKFLRGNLLEPFISNFVNSQISNLVITANLPYLTKKQYQTEPAIRFEPKTALVGGVDGLKYFREFFQQIQILNTKYHPPAGGLNTILEIDPSQSAKIKKLAKKYLSQMKIEIKNDLANRARVVILTSPHQSLQSTSRRD